MIGLQLGCFIISSFCREKIESIHLKQNPSSLSFFSLDFVSSCPAVNGWYDDEPPIFPPERMTYTQKMITPTTAHGIARKYSPSLNSLSRFTNNRRDTSSNKIAIVVQKDCFTENILCKIDRNKISNQLEHNLIIIFDVHDFNVSYNVSARLTFHAAHTRAMQTMAAWIFGMPRLSNNRWPSKLRARRY